MAECDTVCEHIHLPVQAGSDSVLKRMKRAYSRAKYLDKVEMVRAAIPDVAITTDIIVGFPGETEDEFAETLSLVAEARYDAAYTFQYSSRPMTEAADLPGHLPKGVVQERFDRLVDLQMGISLEQNLKLVGSTEQVLVEGVSKKDPGRLTGRTRTNKLVHFDATDAAPGTFATVTIDAAHPHFLDGKSVGAVTTQGPRLGLSLPMVASSAGCSSCA
jgi:tRNA-2-methylthio-N6-dimethylallyladenosine synthase